MKNAINFLLMTMLFFGCKQNSLEENSTYIKGTVGRGFDGTKIFLQYAIKDSIITQKALITDDGKFSFQVANIRYPRKALLTRDTTNYMQKVKVSAQFINKFYAQFGSDAVPKEMGRKRDYKLFALENGTIKVAIADSIYNAKVDGLDYNTELDVFRKAMAPNIAKYNAFKNDNPPLDKITDFKLLDSLLGVSGLINEERYRIVDQYVLNNPNSAVSLFALRNKYSRLNADIVRLYDTLDDSLKNSEVAQSLNSEVERFVANLKTNITVGKIVPEFKLENESGEMISLSEIKAKYIFIDFWTSWCGPCRKENKKIAQYYNQYEKDQFQIIGISADEDINAWKQALIKDKIQWTSLFDAGKRFTDRSGVVSFPTNFLLNSDYQVIDKQLNAEELKIKLNELL